MDRLEEIEERFKRDAMEYGLPDSGSEIEWLIHEVKRLRGFVDTAYPVRTAQIIKLGLDGAGVTLDTVLPLGNVRMVDVDPDVT